MKQSHGWWLPDHEEHLPGWMASPKNQVKLNGRVAYQGRKQIATLAHCPRRQVAVDVGAHVGLWSYNLAAAFGTVHAFEPVKEHRECFIRNLDGAKNVKLYPLALGGAPDWCSIRVEKGSSGNAQVVPGEDVEMVTLDSLQLGQVDLIKCDVEGYEGNVFVGAEETIKKSWPTIIVEQKRNMHERFGLEHLGAVKFLQKLGYKVVQEYSGDFILVKS
jgi:FkbM family methyltransferase